MIKCLVILLLVISIPLQARAEIPCGSTISTSGTHTLEGNKTCNETWVTVTAANVIINMAGYTVTYANTVKPVAGAVTTGGLIVSNSNCEIYGGTLTQGVLGGHGIFSQTNLVTGLNIHNMTINTAQSGSSAIHLRDLSAAGISVTIVDSTFNITTTDGGASNGVTLITSNTITGQVARNTFNQHSGPSAGRPSGVALSGVRGSGGDRFSINNNTFNMYGSHTIGVGLWDSNYTDIHTNTLNMYGDNIKGLQVDGGSEFNILHGNIIYMTSTGVESQSYGIRTRFGADNNEFYGNTCDSSTASNSVCVGNGQLQALQPTDTPKYNSYHNNTWSGISPVTWWLDEHDDTSSYDNTITATDGGIPILVNSWSTVTNNVNRLHISRDAVITTNQYAIRVLAYDTSQPFNAVVFEDITLNGTFINTSKVSDTRTNYPGGWTVTTSASTTATTASPPGGAYSGTQSVSISCTGPCPSIQYCTTGSSCTPSTNYTTPISISATGYLRHRGATDGTITTESYTITTPAPASKSNRLFGPRLTGGVNVR